jgi:hypothetical protein
VKALRWTAASVVWLLGGLLGLVGALLCVTLLLAPLGIPLLFLARRLLKTAGQLVVPRAVRHPIDTLEQKTADTGDDVRKRGKDVGKRGKKVGRKTRKKLRKSSRSTAKDLKRKLPTG